MELKQRMTFDEMAEHMQENTTMLPSKVTVGKYARKLGYAVYKPIIAGVIRFFYVNMSYPLK